MSPEGTLRYFEAGKKIPKHWNKLPEKLEAQAKEIIDWNKEVEALKFFDKQLKAKKVR